MVRGSAPFVHTFRTLTGYYCYDANTNQLIALNRDDWLLLSDRGDQDALENSLTLSRLRTHGLLSPIRSRTIRHPMDRFVASLQGRKLGSVCLQVTQSCNLRCSYCVYSGDHENRSHSSALMTDHVGRAAIAFLVRNSVDSDRINVAFYGGEPLLRFDFVQRMVKYAEITARGRKLTFGITTNGTLISAEIAEYLVRKRFNVTISLDGPEYVHDRNRRTTRGEGTYRSVVSGLQMLARVDREFVRSHLTINVVQDVRGCHDDLVLYLDNSEDLRLVEMLSTSDVREPSRNPQSGPTDADRRRYLVERDRHLFDYLLAELGRSGHRKSGLLVERTEAHTLQQIDNQLSLPRSGAQKEFHPSGPCVPGLKRVFVGADGRFFPCERIDERSAVACIGNVVDGIDVQKSKRLLNIGRLTPDECRACWASAFCTVCAARSLDTEGELSVVDRLQNCERLRAQVTLNLVHYCTLTELHIM